jgi:dienelactone hydrolase
MRCVVLAVLLLLPSWVSPQTTGGPHPVGFRVIEHWDHSRVPSPPLDFRGDRTGGPQATPMLIGVWYPAARSDRAPMRHVDYRMLQQRRETLGAPRPGDREAAGAGLRSIAQFGLALEVDEVAIARALDHPVGAVRDALPQAGPFPVVLGGLEGPAEASRLAEYLASHGYVVLSAPSLPSVASQQVNAPMLALETQTRNIEVLRSVALSLPYVDSTRLGVVGVNFNGMAVLNYQLRNMDARAVVSLDGYEAKAQESNVIGRSPYYDARRMRVPYLVFSQADPPSPGLRADPAQLDLWPFSERRMRVVKELAHVHYVGAIWSLERIPPAVRAAREAVDATVLDFLNAHVRGDAGAMARAFTHTPASSLELDRALAALPAAPTPPEFERLVMDGDAAAVREVVNRVRRADPSFVLFTENEMNLFVFRFTQQDRPEVALELLALTAEHHPRSARAAYRYANALTTRLAGSAITPDPALAARARDEFERAAELLPSDAALSQSDRDTIRVAVSEGLATLGRLGR